MRLTEILKPANIKIPLEAKTKTEAISELVNLLAASGDVTDGKKVLDAVLEREATRTTGIGNGLAIPHGKCAGTKDLVERARFFRKQFGGQMRQAGVLAAAALHGVERHWPRMAEDHANAKLLAGMINEGGLLRCTPPQTNIVIAEVTAPGVTAARVAAALAEHDVHVLAISDRQIRAVTHLDVSAEQVRRAGEAFARVAAALQAEAA